MQFVLVIYLGFSPLPGTPEAERLSKGEVKSAYADFAALNDMENYEGAPPMGLPQMRRL